MVTVQEAGEAEEKASDRVVFLEEGGNEGVKTGEVCLGIASVLYWRDSVFMEELGGVSHQWGGCPLNEGVPGVGDGTG